MFLKKQRLQRRLDFLIRTGFKEVRVDGSTVYKHERVPSLTVGGVYVQKSTDIAWGKYVEQVNRYLKLLKRNS